MAFLGLVILTVKGNLPSNRRLQPLDQQENYDPETSVLMQIEMTESISSSNIPSEDVHSERESITETRRQASKKAEFMRGQMLEILKAIDPFCFVMKRSP